RATRYQAAMSKRLLRVISLFTTVISLSFSPLLAQDESHGHHHHAAEESHEHVNAVHEEEFDIAKMIMQHIADSHEWEFTHGVSIPLPVILDSEDRGLEIFSSANFHNDQHEYNGYRLEHGDAEVIVPLDESRKIYDFSITKNVA